MFPTRVGMNRIEIYHGQCLGGVPHARGDEPEGEEMLKVADACSPRAWG